MAPRRRTARAAHARPTRHPEPAHRLRPDAGEGPGTGYLPPQPTAHAICRICGRIIRLPMTDGEVANLQAFLDRRPDGWTIEGMSFSFTGSCPRCRQGLPP